MRADNAHQEGRDEAAVELYESYLELVPEDASAKAKRAFALLNTDRSKEALLESREAYTLNPSSDGIAMALLDCLDNNGLEEELAEKAEEFSKKRSLVTIPVAL